MRILGLSNMPDSGLGYGEQIGQFARQAQAHGHDMALQAFYGHNHSIVNWRGIPVYPASSLRFNHMFGLDLTPLYMDLHKADLLLTLTDAWVFNPAILSRMHVAHWMPVDSLSLGDPDISTLRASGAIPVAMSRIGQEVLQRAGFPALYAPHGIDTDLFSPPEERGEDRYELRRSFGIEDDEFIVLDANANMDLHRKAWPLKLAAFANFHARHPRSRYLCHTPDDGRPSGLNLARWARRLGIADCVEFCEDDRLKAGLYSPEYLARVFYPLGDCYLSPSRAEGFGLTLVEAAACGDPTIATNFGAMKETGAAGILVDGTPFESPMHTDWWLSPSVEGIDEALEFYWQMKEQGELPKLRAKAREHALQYDQRRVFTEFWVDVLAEIEQRIDGKPVGVLAAEHGEAMKALLAAVEARHRAIDGGMTPDDLVYQERDAWFAYRDSMPTRRVENRSDYIAGDEHKAGPRSASGLPD